MYSVDNCKTGTIPVNGSKEILCGAWAYRGHHVFMCLPVGAGVPCGAAEVGVRHHAYGSWGTESHMMSAAVPHQHTRSERKSLQKALQLLHAINFLFTQLWRLRMSLAQLPLLSLTHSLYFPKTPSFSFALLILSSIFLFFSLSTSAFRSPRGNWAHSISPSHT